MIDKSDPVTTTVSISDRDALDRGTLVMPIFSSIADLLQLDEGDIIEVTIRKLEKR